MSEDEDLEVNKEKRKGMESAEYRRISASTWSEQKNLIKTEGSTNNSDGL